MCSFFEGEISARAYPISQMRATIRSAFIGRRLAGGVMARTTSHILNAASNLLGISLLIITGLHVTNHAHQTLADEIAWGAALCFALASLFSYLDLRAEPADTPYERRADRLFMLGLASIFAAVLILALSDLH